LVVVVEARGVEEQAAAHQGVLGAQLDGVDELGRERLADADRVGRNARVDAAALIALGIEGVEQGVVGEAQVRLVVEAEAAGHLAEARALIGVGRVQGQAVPGASRTVE
jgi:hypothetical protein